MAPLTNLLELPQSCIQQVEVTPHLITLTLSMKTTEAPCPLCERPSRRVHSRYQRTLQDLACGGKTLRLLVQVRRFWCHNAACARKIFAERLPELTGVYARRTTRCTAVLTELSFALGGRPGARLSAGLGIPGNRMTLLRILRRTPVRAVCTPRILGVDEWAYRRGKTYHAPHNLAKTVLEFPVCILRAPLRQRYGVVCLHTPWHQQPNPGREPSASQEGASPL